MNEAILKGIDILKNWKMSNEANTRKFIEKFYRLLDMMRKLEPQRRDDAIFPQGAYIDNYKELGTQGLQGLIIYILENDHRYFNVETIDNYKKCKPFPSYIIYYIYTILACSPEKLINRKVFEAFWEHQSKLSGGIDEQCSRHYLEQFIKAGITAEQEIRDLLIRDWYRWQEAPANSPYYPPAIGITSWYFQYRWGSVEKRLQQEWREKTGKEPKRW